MEAVVYDNKGKEKTKITLPESIFQTRWNEDLVHQVVVSMQANKRAHTAHAKDRSEVRGGGTKPWRQKGTGRARHGSIRSPIWVGGGVAHGPRKEKNYTKKINKKMKAKALFSVLSKKAREGEVLWVDNSATPVQKTKSAGELLSNLAKIKGYEKIAYKTGKRALVVSPEKNPDLARAFQNIKSVSYEELRNMNPLSVLTYTFIIFLQPEACIKTLEEKQK